MSRKPQMPLEPMIAEVRPSSAEDAPTWQALAGEDAPAAAEALVVDVGGFEGPLDLLLALARTHKVDIAKISVLELTEQYIAYISEAQRLKIEIAADYLVMAAWLAFLKSRLILPAAEDDSTEPSTEELAQRLAFRLMRLDAMRQAAASLMTRHRLGRDVFGRGTPEPVAATRDTRWTAEIHDLLKAYAEIRKRTIKVHHVVKARRVWSIKEARGRLERLVGSSLGDWRQLDLFLIQYLPSAEEERTVRASSFGATLELAREGLVEVRQDVPFGPIYLRKKDAGADWERFGDAAAPLSESR